jgi:hypothetical protein
MPARTEPLMSTQRSPSQRSMKELEVVNWASKLPPPTVMQLVDEAQETCEKA